MNDDYKPGAIRERLALIQAEAREEARLDPEALEERALKSMKVGVLAVLAGRIKEFKTTLVSPSKVIEFIEEKGGEQHTPFETNGWDWDYWIHVEHGGHHYTVAGSGYYGGVTVERGWEGVPG